MASSSSGGAVKRQLSGSNSSLQNSDEDDDFGDNDSNPNLFGLNKSREEKRRISHTAAEQKRRNAIKRGYDELQTIVPSCEFMDPSSSQKVCKATVLKRSIDYIHELEKEKDKHEQDLDSLKKEITALKIMKSNYEEILQYHKNMPKSDSVEINEEAKFELFEKFADNLFQSFQTMINPSSFSELSGSMFNWLEQMCSSNNLKNLVLLSLFQVAQQMIH
jgi:MAX-like protein X